MPTNFSVGVDWRRKGFICWEAQSGDVLNLLPSPLRYTQTTWRGNLANSVSRLNQATDYGLVLFAVQSGAGVNNGFVLGQNNALAVNSIPVNVSTSYSVSVRVKGISAYASVPVILRVKDQAGNILGTSSALNLSDTWQKLSLSFTTGGSASHIGIEVIKDNYASDVLFHVTGFMLVAGSEMPNGYNAGHTLDRLDNLGSKVISVNWFLGMRKPYQDIADDGMLELVLNNSDKQFSPENSLSSLAGYLVPFRPIEVRSGDGTTSRTHYSGWIESFTPMVNQYGERQTTVTCAGPMQFFKNQETAVELQQNKRTDEIIDALLDEVPMPPSLGETAILSFDNSNLDEVVFPTITIGRSLQEGQTVLKYAADNWVKQGGSSDQKQSRFNVYHAIKDVVAAERGRFFFNRAGQAVFWNRHHLLTNTSLQATLDNAMTAMEYSFAGLDEFKNDIHVTCHPRELSPDNNDLLWELVVNDPIKDPIRIGRGKKHELNINFTNEGGNKIGARDLHVTGVVFGPHENPKADGKALIKLVPKANGATLLFYTSGNKKIGGTKISGLQVRGQSIQDFGQMEAIAQDQMSITKHGQRSLSLNLPSLDELSMAQDIADFELLRRKDPAGKVASVTLISHGKKSGDKHAEQLALSIGDRIRVKETQSGHDAHYFIIGEAHKLSESATRFETTWYLEAATSTNWARLDDAVLDGAGAEAPEIPYIIAY